MKSKEIISLLNENKDYFIRNFGYYKWGKPINKFFVCNGEGFRLKKIHYATIMKMFADGVVQNIGDDKVKLKST